MGSVWLAEHAVLRKKVAIKVLHKEMSQRQELIARFFNEARAATEISDPGIVQVFDFGKHSDGNAYIVMELLEGEALDRRLNRMGTLPLAAALRICRQVAATLGAAHARGIVHRDIKPDNIFLVRDPEVVGGERTKVLDFGIAKMALDTRVKTQTSALLGTPTFMSPEQCRGAGQVDQRSDIYSLGCVLFTLLTGRPLFDGEGAGDVIAMHLREPPLAPSIVMPGIPAAVDTLVLRCLAKDRAQRFASGSELATGIEELLRNPTVQPLLVESPMMPPGPSISDAPVKQADPHRPATTLVVDPIAALPLAAQEISGAPTIVPPGVVSGEISVGRNVRPAATTLSTSARGGVRARRSLRRWGWGGALVLAPALLGLFVLARRSGSPAGEPDTQRGAGEQPVQGLSEAQPAPLQGGTAVGSASPTEQAAPPEREIDEAMNFVLRAYEGWRSQQRQPMGTPCPKVEELLAGRDGTPLLARQIALVCNASSSGQKVSAVWRGVDGTLGTGDDVSSWDRPADRVAPVAFKLAVPIAAAPPRGATPPPRVDNGAQRAPVAGEGLTTRAVSPGAPARAQPPTSKSTVPRQVDADPAQQDPPDGDPDTKLVDQDGDGIPDLR